MVRKTRPTKTPQDDDRIQEFLDMIAPSVVKFNTDHFICGNTYRCVWALTYMPNIYIIGQDGFQKYCQVFRTLSFEMLDRVEK